MRVTPKKPSQERTRDIWDQAMKMAEFPVIQGARWGGEAQRTWFCIQGLIIIIIIIIQQRLPQRSGHSDH